MPTFLIDPVPTFIPRQFTGFQGVTDWKAIAPASAVAAICWVVPGSTPSDIGIELPGGSQLTREITVGEGDVPYLIPLVDGVATVNYGDVTHELHCYGFISGVEMSWLVAPVELLLNTNIGSQNDQTNVWGWQDIARPSNATGVILFGSSEWMGPSDRPYNDDFFFTGTTICPIDDFMAGGWAGGPLWIVGWYTGPIDWGVGPLSRTAPVDSIDQTVTIDDRYSAYLFGLRAAVDYVYPDGASIEYEDNQSAGFVNGTWIMGPLTNQTGIVHYQSGSATLARQFSTMGKFVKFDVSDISGSWTPVEPQYPDYSASIREPGRGFVMLAHSAAEGVYTYTTIADMEFYLSGGAANADPLLSIGGAVSTTQVGITLNDLLADFSIRDSIVGRAAYRCIYVSNDSGVDTAVGAVVYLAGQATSGEVAIGLAPEGLNGTAQNIASQYNTPDGVVFSNPQGEAGALEIDAMAPGDVMPVWVKHSATPGNRINETVSVTLTVAVMDNGP